MRRREYLGQLELMVLLAVMRPGGDAYGVLIARDIADKSGREIALASVYAALERLEHKGLLSSSLGQPVAERGGKARTYFKATAAGIREAREAHATLLRLSAGLPALKSATHALHGQPARDALVDDEQATACAGGCDARVARVAREGHPGSTVSGRRPRRRRTA